MIQVNKLDFHYRKEAPVLKDTTFALGNGIIGLFGRNGSGKTTLLHLLAGLLGPKSGDITVNGFRPRDRRASFLADMYFLPEQLEMKADMSLERHVQLMAPFYPNFDMTIYRDIIDQAGLQDRLKLNQLSTGMLKLFQLAFALASRCKVLLLDEPTNGLDIPNKKLFRKMLIKYIDQDQLVLISTHLVGDIEDVVEHLLFLHNGKIIMNLSIEALSEIYGFHFGTRLPERALYHEKFGGAYHYILDTPSQGKELSKVNIELLFNAATQNYLKPPEPKLTTYGNA